MNPCAEYRYPDIQKMNVAELQALHRHAKRERTRNIIKGVDFKEADRVMAYIGKVAWERGIKGDVMSASNAKLNHGGE